MPDQQTGIGVAALGLLLLAGSLVFVLMVWQLLRAWRRHDARGSFEPKPRRLLADLWQVSGHRLVARLNFRKPDGPGGSFDPPGDQPDES